MLSVNWDERPSLHVDHEATSMKSILKKTGAGLFMALLATFCAAAPRPSERAAKADSGYILGPDDQIIIRAIDAPEISDKPVLIGTNGNITLPLIGRVQAGGLTVEQLETELNNRLKKYVQDPQISVTVSEFRSQPVSVFGGVAKPGVIQLRGSKTLYEVLSMAGGPNETAGSSLTVTRRRENGEIPLPGATIDPTGQFSTAELNVQEIREGKNPAANIEIKPNDTISVSEANSNMIYVVGDVGHGGAFTLGGRQSLSVLKGLSLAGGLGRTAKPQKARIIRGVAGEPKPQEIAVNIKQILAGKAEDVLLQPQDVLVVPTSSGKVFATYSVPSMVSAAVSAAIYH
jgi:polysaccharide biosynthesis/export protein